MAVSQYDQPYPSATDGHLTQLSKAAVLFGQMVSGNVPLNSFSEGIGSNPAPAGFSRTYTYYGATNNVQTITYKQGSDVIGKVTYTYIAGGVADNDDIATEVWTAN